MKGNLMDELRKAYKQARVIGIALIIGIFAYAVAVEAIKRAMAPFEGFSPFSTDHILRYLLFACAVSIFFAIKIIKKRMLSGESKSLSSSPSLQPPSPSQASSLSASKSPASPSSLSPSTISAPQRNNLFSPPVQKLVIVSVISLALSETVAIFGFVIFLINGSSLDFYLFFILSIIFIIIHFPRYSQWEEWIEKIEVSNRLI